MFRRDFHEAIPMQSIKYRETPCIDIYTSVKTYNTLFKLYNYVKGKTT